MRLLTTGLVACVLALTAVPAMAGSASKTEGELIDPLNHAFAIYLGGGLYVTGDQTVFIIRATGRFRIRDERKHRFGVRLRLIGMIGLYDFDLDSIPDIPIDELPDLVGTWAVVPGVEFPIRIFDNWTLMPFADMGVASDTQLNDLTVVTGVGARSRAEFHDKWHTHVLWNELIAAANHDQKLANPDDYTVFNIDYELRGIVDYKLFKREFDLGLLLKSETYFNSPLLGLPGAEIEVRQRWEVGFTTGATERWKTVKKMVTAPRLGITYRFGEGTSAVRFVLRFRN